MDDRHSPAAHTQGDRSRWFLIFHPVVAVIAILALAVVAGAGGVTAAFGNLAVQLVAVTALAIHGPAVWHFFRSAPIGLRILAIVTVALPLIQLVPLPPALWQGLPGRDLVAQSLDLAGGRGWFPISLDGARTLIAALGLLAPLAVLTIAMVLPAAGLARVQWAVVALGAGSALFGSLHLVNPAWGDLYAAAKPMPGILVGTFADRNAAALFFVGCLLLLIGSARVPVTPTRQLIAGAAGGFLALAVVLTGSRTGMVLLALPLVLLLWRGASLGKTTSTPQSRRSKWWLAGAGVLLASLAVVVATSGRGQASLDRFDQGDGMRAELREDARFAAQHYWPVGAGMGTFDEVFQNDESLENISPVRAGRAHMDYLELAIEAGLCGVLLLSGWLVWLLLAGWRAVVRPGAWPARGAFLIAVGIAAQSLLSFPLRNQAMLCLAALAIALLVRSPVAERRA